MVRAWGSFARGLLIKAKTAEKGKATDQEVFDGTPAKTPFLWGKTPLPAPTSPVRPNLGLSLERFSFRRIEHAAVEEKKSGPCQTSALTSSKPAVVEKSSRYYNANGELANNYAYWRHAPSSLEEPVPVAVRHPSARAFSFSPALPPKGFEWERVKRVPPCVPGHQKARRRKKNRKHQGGKYRGYKKRLSGPGPCPAQAQALRPDPERRADLRARLAEALSNKIAQLPSLGTVCAILVFGAVTLGLFLLLDCIWNPLVAVARLALVLAQNALVLVRDWLLGATLVRVPWFQKEGKEYVVPARLLHSLPNDSEQLARS